jgi:hypothetical protein
LAVSQVVADFVAPMITKSGKRELIILEDLRADNAI